MSTYVFSDVHGHRAALERVLERISPASDDRFMCLGDLVDRGPDPLGCIQIARSLPNNIVLMGNHEELMLAALFSLADPEAPQATEASINWACNGGAVTSEALAALDDDEAGEFIEWAAGLPRWATCTIDEQDFLFVHAGVDLSRPQPPRWETGSLKAYAAAQALDSLVWVREEFWAPLHGLQSPEGRGPIVVAGHTPTPYLSTIAQKLDREPIDDAGRARMVRAGAEADRWAIDCAAAAGAGLGQVLVLRLDDGAEFYEPINEGE